MANDGAVHAYLPGEQPAHRLIYQPDERAGKRDHAKNQNGLDHAVLDSVTRDQELIQSSDAVCVHRDERDRERRIDEASFDHQLIEVVPVDIIGDRERGQQRE